MKTRILICLLLFALCLLPLAHAADLSIGRMRASIWPEYDDPGVLVIYDGRFKDDASFPLETVFYIPKGSQISDACSLSPKGQHFCQLYKQKNIGDFDEVRLKLPYPNFYLSFHVNPFDAQDIKKSFSYVVKANHNIDKLEVDIQKPLRTEDFKVIPEPMEKTEARGFEHFGYVYENVAKGKEIKFDIQYIKKDSHPSQDIKYSPMSGQKVFGSPFEERKKFSNAMLLAGVIGLLLLAGMLVLVFRGKK
ncbi:MAG: hypothetical protein HZB79_10380 [Deltaproteobacteria bacterium]|nr:hypothetical protein [Deltaproteobacteria bacterium]